MHRVPAGRWLTRALKIGDRAPPAGIPLFLCPAVRHSSFLTRPTTSRPARSLNCQRRENHAEATVVDAGESQHEAVEKRTRKLPVTCHGCGAFTQTDDPNTFGFFNPESKRVRSWIHPREPKPAEAEESDADQVVNQALSSMSPEQLEELGISATNMIRGEESEGKRPEVQYQEYAPVCERCHNLLHYNLASDTAKLTMHHPTVESLRETIEESPHKYNHIYHVIDAADFPMSLVPRLNVLLGDIEFRTKNRRSRSGHYQKDRKTEMSFIITRGDLLGPTKAAVDSLMPYLREVLRDALGRLGGRVRLGNVRCVSARRGWWTRDLKEEIWRRGGAGWMVGKVNVGKSWLFEAVYPKGRGGLDKAAPERGSVATFPRESAGAEPLFRDDAATSRDGSDDYGDLLPPLQPAQMYPSMPVVSSLPGTTASPIRVPFGNGKGELIDLPGLVRSDLDLFVKEKQRQSLVMKTRIIPEQLSVKVGSSLLLGGGLIRITPRTPDLTFLMYNFTPIEEHLTATDKAVGFQDQTRESIGLENITLPGAGDKMKHAGTFKLCYDVTKRRAGPLTRKNAVGLGVDQLPFRVLSIDLLIEGVGYVELIVQMRARDMRRLPPLESPRTSLEEEAKAQSEEEELKQPPVDSADPFEALISKRKDSRTPDPTDPFAALISKRKDSRAPPARAPPAPRKPTYDLEWPAVDVYTPEGRFVGFRQPINGWMNNKPLVRPEHKRVRPRKSMKGQKKKAKLEKRAQQAAATTNGV